MTVEWNVGSHESPDTGVRLHLKLEHSFRFYQKSLMEIRSAILEYIRIDGRIAVPVGSPQRCSSGGLL